MATGVIESFNAICARDCTWSDRVPVWDYYSMLHARFTVCFLLAAFLFPAPNGILSCFAEEKVVPSYSGLLWQQGKPPSSIENVKSNQQKPNTNRSIDFSDLKPSFNWVKNEQRNSAFEKYQSLHQNKPELVQGKEIKKDK